MLSCPLPTCYQADLEDALLRFKRWCLDNECVVFPVVADLHSNLTTTDPLFGQKRDSAAHILLLNDVADRFNADFTVNLGDVGVDVPLKEMDEIETLSRRILEYHAMCRQRPVIFVLGNHDCGYGKLPEDYWGRAFLKINSKVQTTHSEDGNYGFYDIPQKQTRIFWLNTSDGEEEISDAQLKFLKDNLHSMPADFCAVMLNHVCTHERLGVGAKSLNAPRPANFAVFNHILVDFVKCGGRLVGTISGHSHFDADGRYDGINYFVLQGYGGIGPKETPAHARIAQVFNPKLNRTDTFDMDKYTMIHLVAIKPQQREMRIFRIGAGGSVCDRGAYF